MKDLYQVSQKALKKFLTLSLILAISLSSVKAYGQQCEFVYDSEGNIVKDAYVVDGVTGLFFEQKRATKILGTLTEYEMLTKKNDLQQQKIDVLTASLEDARQQAEFWKTSYEAAMATIKGMKDNKAFYTSDVAVFAYGFIAASIAYGYWSYTDK